MNRSMYTVVYTACCSSKISAAEHREPPAGLYSAVCVSVLSLSAESVSSCVYSLSRCALSAVCAAAPKNIVFCVICCSVSAPLLLLWEVVRLILKNKISNRPQSCGVRCSSSRATKQGIICIYYVKCTLCNSCAQCIAHTTAFYKIYRYILYYY